MCRTLTALPVPSTYHPEKPKMFNNPLLKIYRLLYSHFGPQNWWPAQSAFEVIVGAVLTQNTSWRNVEKAIENLKRKNLLDPIKIHKAKRRTLLKLIKPVGYYNIKTERLKELVKFIVEKYDGDISLLKKKAGEELRNELLKVKGVGKETADSILLYALNKPFFVVDGYTKRMLARHHLLPEGNYDTIQEMFHKSLPRDVKIYNEYHALIVRLGKTYCQNRPKCPDCPIFHI